MIGSLSSHQLAPVSSGAERVLVHPFQELAEPAGVMRLPLGAADVGARIQVRAADPYDRPFEVGHAHDLFTGDVATNGGNRHTSNPGDATSLPMIDRQNPPHIQHAGALNPCERGIVRSVRRLSDSVRGGW